MSKAGEQPTITQSVIQADRSASCDLGVGCDEAGVCYANANGKPEMCHRTTSLAAQDIVDCETCCGSGEVVTDWDRYKHPHDGDVGDEAVADCPDCDGNGKIEVPSLAAQDGLVDALEVIAAGEGCMNGIREELSADALRKIARNALSAIKGDK